MNAPVSRGLWSFLKRVGQRLAPRSKFQVGVLIYVVICALSPWILSRLLYPADPLPVRVLYRSPEGDINYFPLINAVSRGQLGDFSVYEQPNAGVQSFPMASIIFHVLAVSLLGTFWGYVAADIIVFLLFFPLLREWCKLFSADERWTSFIAAFFVSGLPRFLPLTHHLWGMHIPRPFVADVYFVSWFTLIAWLAWRPQHLARVWPWLWLGILLSLTLQSYIYYLPVYAAALFYLVSVWVLEEKTRWKAALVGMIELLAAFLLVSGFFFYQRLHEAPDALARLGVFPVDRLKIWTYRPWVTENHGSFVSVAVVLALAFASFSAKRFHLETIPRRVLGLLLFLPVASFLAVPVTASLTGKLIQPYHYATVSGAIQSCLVVALIVYVGQLLFGMRNRTAGGAWMWLILIAALFATPLLEFRKEEMPEGGEFTAQIQGPGHRAAFVRLTRELNRDIYQDDRVMAFLNAELYSYWVGFLNRYAFLPDPFSSTLSNQALEDRMLWYARELNISDDSLGLFLDRDPILIALGHDLYQCSPLYHKSGLDDYSPQDLQRNMSRSPSLYSWNLALPLSDLRRLRSRYHEILALPEQDKPRLDLIVITADAGRFAMLSPDPSRYRLTYHDDCYSVWQALGRR